MEKTEQRQMPSIDRLSSLPDGVICHILSFLPTKNSVATSILSRRWRFLWTHVPNLDFDREEDYTETMSCPNIINRVMLLHKVQSLNTFYLRYREEDCSVYELETWITTAVARNVKNLYIYLYCPHRLPQCLFTCKTLVDLMLDGCNISLTGPIYLPSLKKLYIYCAGFVGEDLSRLFSGCPVLEELTMIRHFEDELICCNIFSPTIKRLTLDFLYYGSGYFDDDYTVEINAPAVRYLELTDSISTHLSAQMLTSLIEAKVHLNHYKEVANDDPYFLSLLNFVDSLCTVKCLKLSICTMFFDGAFADQCKSITRFDNLTKLEWAADWLFLLEFLESADNLEVLIINEVEECLKYWVDPEQVPTCLLSHLETVRINKFEGTEQEFNIVRYLLKNAKVLKRMEIYSLWFDFKAKFDALHKISLFQRGSEACELAFY